MPPPASKPAAASLSSPSAPLIAEEQPTFSSLLPVAPPKTATTATHQALPPSFDQFESEVIPNDIDDTAFRLDTDGNEMPSEERTAMILEQEKIMKQIEE